MRQPSGLRQRPWRRLLHGEKRGSRSGICVLIELVLAVLLLLMPDLVVGDRTSASPTIDYLMSKQRYNEAIDLIHGQIADGDVTSSPRVMYDLAGSHYRLAHLYEEMFKLISYLGEPYYRNLLAEIYPEKANADHDADYRLLKLHADMYAATGKPDMPKIEIHAAFALTGDEPCSGLLGLLLGQYPAMGHSWALGFCEKSLGFADDSGHSCPLLSRIAEVCINCNTGVNDPFAGAGTLDSLLSESTYRQVFMASASRESLDLVFPHGLLVLRELHLDRAGHWYDAVLKAKDTSSSLADGARYGLLKCLLISGDRTLFEETLPANQEGPVAMLHSLCLGSETLPDGLGSLVESIDTKGEAVISSDVLLLMARIGGYNALAERLADRCVSILELNPGVNPGVYTRLGIVNLHLGRYENASDLFSKGNINPLSGHESLPPAYIVAYAASMCREEPLPYKFALMTLYMLEQHYRSVFLVRRLLLGLAVQHGIDAGAGFTAGQ